MNEHTINDDHGSETEAAQDAADRIEQYFVREYASLRSNEPAAFEKIKAKLPPEFLAKLDE